MRSASRSPASIAACAATSSSEKGDTTAGLGAFCAPPTTAGSATILLLPPRAGAALKPDASSTADIDISDRATMIWSAEMPKECLFCFFFIDEDYASCSSTLGICHCLEHGTIH